MSYHPSLRACHPAPPPHSTHHLLLPSGQSPLPPGTGWPESARIPPPSGLAGCPWPAAWGHTRGRLGEVPVPIARFVLPRSKVILCVPQPARWLGRLGSHFPLRRRPSFLVALQCSISATPSPSLCYCGRRQRSPPGIDNLSHSR